MIAAVDDGRTGIRSYHGQPVIKEPVWTWEIPVYLYAGGLCGGSSGLAFLSGLRGNEVLARRAWTAALAAGSVSPVLLSSDLGRPLRALNMFRMFKITSPMSVGSWILVANGLAVGVAAGSAWTPLFPRAGKVARPAAALIGLPLSTYTAALVANTAVPAWHEARRMLPFVFAAGASLSAGAMGVMLTPVESARPARRLALAGALVGGALLELMPHRLGAHGEAYQQGLPARLAMVSRISGAIGFLLLARRGASSRRAAAAGGALLTAAAMATRWSVFKAGFRSAADPKYVVGPQRQAIQKGERTGAARGEARAGAGDGRLGSPATAV